jgi:[ribosomal protein S5]-alanine N-acetyltransferase
MNSQDTPTLRTSRFVLRQLEQSDAAALFPTFADRVSMRWWVRAPFETEAELAKWLVPESGWEEGRSWAIIDSVGGPAIGRIAVMDRGDDVAEIGYLISHARRREGIAREALVAVIDYLITTERKRRLFADIDPDNAASNELVAKLGFTLEGRLREHATTHIGRRDSLIWGLLACEWQKAKEIV